MTAIESINALAAFAWPAVFLFVVIVIRREMRR